MKRGMKVAWAGQGEMKDNWNVNERNASSATLCIRLAMYKNACWGKEPAIRILRRFNINTLVH